MNTPFLTKQKVEEIRARYNAVENMNPATVVDYQEFARQAHRDRLDLLNYIDSLNAEPDEERTPIDSPSEICAMIGCKRRDDHQHIVVEHPNRT